MTPSATGGGRVVDDTLPGSAVLEGSTWRDAADRHRTRAEALTSAHRARAARGEKHPVEDFLFTYYSYRPSLLRRWHPGAGVELRDAEDRLTWRWYARGRAQHSAVVDEAAFDREKGMLRRQVARILSVTTTRPPQYGCFGLHEWAMVYRDGTPRHDVPLRLGSRATDAVVEAHDLRCTHFDAFRFFTPESVPRNRTPLSREAQTDHEQPGCLHAGMDLYRWAVKLGPLVEGSVLLDCFELARDIRALDMRASPYDLADWGYDPVPVETPAGKTEYVRAQRLFAERAAPLRARLLAVAEG